MDRVTQKPAMLATTLMIVASYACLAIWFTLPHASTCFGLDGFTTWHSIVLIVLLALVVLVAILGRLKVLWLIPQIVLLILVLLAVFGPGQSHAATASDIKRSDVGCVTF